MMKNISGKTSDIWNSEKKKMFEKKGSLVLLVQKNLFDHIMEIN